MLADYDVPKVVLCITKTDNGIPDSEEVSSLLDTVKDKFSSVNVFDKVLYTSARGNTFKFCTPDKYNASTEYHIYNTETNETVLANKLYELCGGEAEQSQDYIYRQLGSFGNIGYEAHFQNETFWQRLFSESNSEYENFHIALYGSETFQDHLGQSSFVARPTTSKGRKYALGLGITAALLTLIFGTGYYEYDRHFRTLVKTKTKTTPATASAK